MRNLAAGAALAAALIVAGQARAQLPTNVNQRAAPGNSYDFGIQRLISGLLKRGGSTSSSSSSTSNAPVPIARPQPISPRNTTLTGFIPKVTLPSATPVHGFSTYPSEDQLPGSAYLKAFNVKRAPRVPID